MEIRAGSGGRRNGDLADGQCFPEELQPLHWYEGYNSIDPKPIAFGHMPFGEKTVTEESVDGKKQYKKKWLCHCRSANHSPFIFSSFVLFLCVHL